MTDLERRLTAALERLSAQYEREQRRHSERVAAFRRQVEQQTVQSETLRKQVEQLDGQVTRWTDYFGTLAARSRGRWI